MSLDEASNTNMYSLGKVAKVLKNLSRRPMSSVNHNLFLFVKLCKS
jgi:hypothetical protein